MIVIKVVGIVLQIAFCIFMAFAIRDARREYLKQREITRGMERERKGW